MEQDIDEMLEDSPLKVNSSELASQDKMIIRIKKQEQDIDIEGKDLSSDQEEIVSYTCEFVQKVDESKSEFNDLCDEPIESVRQDENFIYPALTNSDEEDTNDVTWQPPINILKPEERKHIKCLYPKIEKPLSKKKKKKNFIINEKIAVKCLKKDQLPKSKPILDLNISKLAVDIVKPDVSVINDTQTKKSCDSVTPKVCKPRKGMATPKQRLGRIIKIHKMMK